MGGVWFSLLVAMGIQAGGVCPTADEVRRRLGPLLPPALESDGHDLAAIEEDADGGVTVSLARFEQATIARRHLPRAASCSDQAETVAVALAVWIGQGRSEVPLRLDHLSPSASSTSRPPAAVGADSRPLPTVALGAGLAGAWQPGSLAPAVRFDAVRGMADRPFRGRLSLAAVGEHVTGFPPGQARWWRVYLAPGADYAIPLSERWTLAVGAAGVIGVVSVMGEGYASNYRAWSLDLGAEVLLRLERRLGDVRPWLGLATVTWLRRQQLAVRGDQASPALPPVEPMALLGVDFLWGR